MRVGGAVAEMVSYGGGGPNNEFLRGLAAEMLREFLEDHRGHHVDYQVDPQGFNIKCSDCCDECEEPWGTS